MYKQLNGTLRAHNSICINNETAKMLGCLKYLTLDNKNQQRLSAIHRLKELPPSLFAAALQSYNSTRSPFSSRGRSNVYNHLNVIMVLLRNIALLVSIDILGVRYVKNNLFKCQNANC